MRTGGDPRVGDDAMNAPHDTILEHALLVARGVRPMALVDVLHVVSDVDGKKLHQQLSQYAADVGGSVLPFTIVANERVPEWAPVELQLTYCGFAAARWVVELMRFAVTQDESLRHPIIGLLLGYSPAAIQSHQDFTVGKWRGVGG